MPAPKTNKAPQPTQPTVPQDPVADVQALLSSYQSEIKAKLDKRYGAILAAIDKEVNIGKRYELKVQLDELMNVYALIFK